MATGAVISAVIEHADGRQRERRRQHAAEAGKARTQAAVEQDQRQRDRADQVGGADIVELEAAGPALAGQHADDQEHQQQRRAEAQRDQTRQDAGEHQQAAEQDGDADGVEQGHRANLLLL